jgi:hypothetical protein
MWGRREIKREKRRYFSSLGRDFSLERTKDFLRSITNWSFTQEVILGTSTTGSYSIERRSQCNFGFASLHWLARKMLHTTKLTRQCLRTKTLERAIVYIYIYIQ